MKQIINYIRNYFSQQNKWLLIITSVFTAILIYVNYTENVDASISRIDSFLQRFNYRYIIFLIAFIIPYFFYSLINQKNIFSNYEFILFVVLAPAIFAIKASATFQVSVSDNHVENNYWEYIIYWPLLLFITSAILFITWKYNNPEQPLYGFKIKGISWKPYWIMLLIMIPLIAAASTQPDFLAMYPKLNSISENGSMSLWKKILFELSYGSDFFTIEFFFRGFLVLGFIKWVGKDAILPMAVFYCSIHFGKPLGECISSYFGGILLGIVVFNTRSIFGGLMVHLGIAWLMELGGYIGNAF